MDKKETYPYPLLNNLFEITQMTFLSVLFLYLIFLAPQLWFVSFSILPFPVLYVSAKSGIYSGATVGILIFIISGFLIGAVLSLLFFVFIMLMGIGQSIMVSKNFSANKFLYLSTVIIVSCFLMAGVFSYAVYRINVFNTGKKIINLSLNEAKKVYIENKLYKSAGLSRSQFEESFELTKKTAQTVPYLLPSIIVLFSGWVVLLNIIISQYGLKVLKLSSNPLLVFSKWQMPWYFTWGFIFGLTLKLFYRYFPFSYMVSSIIGNNLLIAFGVLFFIQGFCVIYSFFEKKKVSALKKGFFMGIALFVQFLFQGLTWLGLFDVWFDYRGLLREEDNGAGS